MRYKVWNDAIAAHFFREENAGERVYLHVSQDLIKQIGTNHGLPESECIADFVTAAKEKHKCAKSCTVVEAPLQWLKMEESWSKLWADGCPYPPYIGHLGLFVLAAGYNPEGDFPSGSYYPRLNALIDREPDESSPAGFEQLHQAWEHLEKWANEEKKGKLGLFEIQRVDDRPHVGIPRSQRILTDYERKVARWVFSQTGLDPVLTPSEEEIASLVRRYGRGEISSRSYNLLAPGSDKPKYRQALIEALQDVLHNWDGSPVKIDKGKKKQTSTAYRGLLALSFRESFGEVNFRIRCLTQRNFPEGELVLQDEKGNKYYCHEVISGWSTALRNETGDYLDPGVLDLSKDNELIDPDQDWRFKIRPASVRAFLPAKEKGLPNIGGFLETRQLPLKTPFYLLVRETETEHIEEWGRTACEDFEEACYHGVPHSWKLYKSAGARNDIGVRQKYDVLSQPREAKITLDGGVRVQPKTNEYFVFAPPSIRVRGSETVEVYLNGNKLQNSDGELYTVPADLLTEGEYRVTAKAEGEIIKRKFFSLRRQTDWKEVPALAVDRFGFAQEHDTQGPSDGVGREEVPGEIPLNLLPDLLKNGSSKVYLIGATPGQIVEWPSEELPEDWQAVWAVPKGGRARYCWPGESPPEPKPVPDLNRVGGLLYPRSKINSWKQVLYHWRKRTTPPVRHAGLWRQYRMHAQTEC
jgi:hypothetical protein